MTTPERLPRHGPLATASNTPPYRIQSLPTVLPFADLPGGAIIDGAAAELTLGVRDEDLGPAVLPLDVNDHVLVAGSPRSGKTSTLALIASLVRAADPGAVLIGICQERSPLYPLEAFAAAGTLTQLAHVVRAAPSNERLWFILVDDAPGVADVESLLVTAVKSGRPGLHVARCIADRTRRRRGSRPPHSHRRCRRGGRSA